MFNISPRCAILLCSYKKGNTSASQIEGVLSSSHNSLSDAARSPHSQTKYAYREESIRLIITTKWAHTTVGYYWKP